MRSILPLYLQHLGESVKFKSAVEEAVNAIGWVHQVSGLPPIAESPFVRATLSGLQRKLARPKAESPFVLATLSGECYLYIYTK